MQNLAPDDTYFATREVDARLTGRSPLVIGPRVYSRVRPELRSPYIYCWLAEWVTIH